MPADLSGIMSQAETEYQAYLQQAACPTAYMLGTNSDAITATERTLAIKEFGEKVLEAYKLHVEHKPIDDWAALKEEAMKSVWPRFERNDGGIFVQDCEGAQWRHISYNTSLQAPPPPPATPPQRPWSDPITNQDRDGPAKPMQPRHKPVERTIPAWPTHDPLTALYAPYEPPV